MIEIDFHWRWSKYGRLATARCYILSHTIRPVMTLLVRLFPKLTRYSCAGWGEYDEADDYGCKYPKTSPLVCLKCYKPVYKTILKPACDVSVYYEGYTDLISACPVCGGQIVGWGMIARFHGWT